MAGLPKTASELLGITPQNVSQIELDALKQQYRESIERDPNLLVSSKYTKTLLRLTKTELGELFFGLIHALYNGEDIEETEENKNVLVLMSLILDETEANFERYKVKAANGFISAIKRKKKEMGLR